MSSGIYYDVFDILAGDKEKLSAPFHYQIVAGTICADLLDYLKRDAFFCGVAQGYDERIFRYFSIIDGQFVIELQKRGLFRHDALSELINLLRIRYTLTERVYYHHAKAVAGAMISKALELALENQKIKLEDLYELRDDSFLYFLKTKTHNRAVTKLVTAIENRQLYKRVYLLTLKQNESKTGITADEQKVLVKKFYYNEDLARTKAEQEITDRLGLTEGSVIIYCPSASMALKEASVLVKIDDQAPRSLKDFQNAEIKTLTDKHRYLWRFFVCLDRKYENKFEQVGQTCEEIFGHPNMIKLQSQGQLTFEF
ncbi:MAG: hypothetical protein IPK14_09790 [Blastocatellia bacterium]|nr:hypothetical protein [Blastocatellia bacterium]